LGLSVFGTFDGLPALLILDMTFFFLAGTFYKASSYNTLGEILQNSVPRLFMIFDERVGGSVAQQRQILERHVSALKPCVFPLSLSLLLTSVTTIGALVHFLFKFTAEVDTEFFEGILSFSGVSISLSMLSVISS
jgi:hypothetical protein